MHTTANADPRLTSPGEVTGHVQHSPGQLIQSNIHDSPLGQGGTNTNTTHMAPAVHMKSFTSDRLG